MKYSSLVKAQGVAMRLEEVLGLGSKECPVVVLGHAELYVESLSDDWVELGNGLCVAEDDGVVDWEYHSVPSARNLKIQGIFLHGETISIKRANAIIESIQSGKSQPGDYGVELSDTAKAILAEQSQD